VLAALSLLEAPSAVAVQVPIGPSVAGQIHAFTFDPDDSSVMYAGGDMFGVYRSTDGGLSWHEFNAGLQSDFQTASGYVDDLLVLGQGSGVDAAHLGVYAATQGGIYFRQSGSNTWELMTDLDSYSQYGSDSLLQDHITAVPINYSSLAFDPTTKTMFAGAGHARWVDNYTSYPVWPYFDGFSQSPDQQYSLWELDLSMSSDVWSPVASTEQKGLVRQLAVTNISGELHVVFSSSNGIHYVSSDDDFAFCENLANASKSLPPTLTWSAEYWGVGFGYNGRLYCTLHRDAPAGDPCVYHLDILESGSLRTWVPLGDLDADVEEFGRLPQEWETWQEHIDDIWGFDLTTMTVIPGASADGDVIYVGERDNTSLGGVYINQDCGDGVRKWRHLIQVTGSWNSFQYCYLDPNACEVTGGYWDPGWTDNVSINPTVEFSVAPSDPDVMVAWMYHTPIRSSDGGASWAQIYCEESAGSWGTRGLGEMGVTSLAAGEDGRLVIGCRDYGAFESVDPSNQSFEWLDQYAVSSALPWNRDFVDDVEVFQGRITAVRRRSGWQVKHDIVEYDPSVQEGFTVLLSADNSMVSTHYSGGSWRIADHMVRTDGSLVVLTVGSSPVGSDLWAYENIGGWSWRHINTTSYPFRATVLSEIPGTDSVVIGSTADGSGVGGLYAVDMSIPDIVETWIDPNWTTLGPYARGVRSVAIDDHASVIYVGTYGSDHYHSASPWRGAVLRLVGPFADTPVEADWEIIANNAGENSFAVDENPYHLTVSGDSRQWVWSGDEHFQMPADIGGLAIDPEDPSVVYAGMNLLWLSDSNGVWKYQADIWEQIVGGSNGGPSRGVMALLFDPLDPATLYVGTDGEEVVQCTVPEAAEASITIADDAYSPIWLSGGGQELEINIMTSGSVAIQSCRASVHDLIGESGPSTGSVFVLNDGGLSGDDQANDGVYSVDVGSIMGNVVTGEYLVSVWAIGDDGSFAFSEVEVVVTADDLAAKFEDFSYESDIGFTGTPYSSLAFDGNEDGFEDILVTVQGAQSSNQVKYQTHPTGCPIYHDTINDDYDATSLQTASDCRGLSFGDFDNDGDDDLFVAHASALLLLENTGPKPIGQFDDASVTGLTATETADSWAGAWGDYNADGWLDLYISRADQDPQGKDYVDADPVSDRFMLGVDGTTFVSSTWFSGVLTDAQPSFAAAWCDVEQDGDMDLFVPAANADGTSAGARFYETVTESQFEDGLVSWFPDVEIANSTSAAWADLDNDGDLDLVLSQLAGLKPHDPARPYIFLKDDTADSFTQDTTALPLVDLPTWDVRPLDYDLDGWMDLLLIPAQLDATVPSRAPKLYRNACTSPLAFEDVSDASGIGDLASVINGATPADYDLDGDMDLFLGRPTAGDEGFFYLSEASGTPNSWLGVRLEGSEDIVANRSCIGAQVMVTSLDGGTILSGAQNNGGGAGRGGDAARGLRFGLGAATGPVVVKTHWLNGFVQRDTVAVDQIVMVQDRTPPTITTGSVSIQTTVWPGGLVWGFSWDSEYLLADSVDQVILNGPSTNWADVTITPANAAHAVDETSHSLLGFQTGCAKGVHTVQVKMSSNGQTRAETKTYNVRVCLSGF